MPTEWTIAVDWNRNGSYADLNDNLTNRVHPFMDFQGQPGVDALADLFCG